MKFVRRNRYGAAIDVQGAPSLDTQSMLDVIDASIIRLRANRWEWAQIGMFHGITAEAARKRFRRASPRARQLARGNFFG